MKHVESKNDIEVYYAQVSQTIIKLIKATEYQAALELIDNELAAPYIPINFYNYFLQTKTDVEKLFREQEFQKDLSNATKLQMWNKTFNTQTAHVDLAYLNLMLDKYADQIDELDLVMFQQILNHKKVDNSDKTYLISILKELGVDHTFELWNSFLKTSFMINPKLVVLPNEQVVGIASSLEEHFFKDPSKLEIALNLLQVLQIKFFPNQINFPINDIINTIINVTNALFGNTTLMSNSITNLFEEFLK